jgi:phenylpropionate dioxygenase-like ring-hydroxylating dioxygenase large terminal subunit
MASRYPFSPFPDGWFFVCYSHELPRGKLFSKTFMGKEVVAFRGADGNVAVADAYCPHLGAHMGKGGCIENDALKCPFHGFRFESSGKCVSTPYGEPPKAGKLALWPVQEANGFILAYYDAEGREPSWRVPELDDAGWGKLVTRRYRLRGHPQETTENGVDSGHLMTVHGYQAVSVVEPLKIEGPYLTGTYQMRRDAGPLEHLGVKLEPVFCVNVWGLGYSMVETHLKEYGLRGQQWVFSTPSDGEYIDLHIALRVREVEHPERILPGLEHVPQRLLMAGVRKFFMHAFENDIGQDFEIWENKGYMLRPAIAKNDGPIGQYRRYCRQFYPELRVKDAASAAE